MKALRISKVFGVALGSAAVLATGAPAADRPDDRAGMLGVGATQVVVVPDAFERAVLRSTELAPPDAFERAVLRSTELAPPDAFERAVLRVSNAGPRPDDRAGARGPGAMPSTVASVAAARANDGFAWGDAFVGAAGVLSILLLGTATMLTIRHRGRTLVR